MAQHVIVVVGKVLSLNTASKRKTIKIVPTAAKSEELIVRVDGMPWPKTGETHCHAQLVLPDKGRANKELVI